MKEDQEGGAGTTQSPHPVQPTLPGAALQGSMLAQPSSFFCQCHRKASQPGSKVLPLRSSLTF